MTFLNSIICSGCELQEPALTTFFHIVKDDKDGAKMGPYVLIPSQLVAASSNLTRSPGIRVKMTGRKLAYFAEEQVYTSRAPLSG
jgi:hypothetical protein